jgi:glycosidase
MKRLALVLVLLLSACTPKEEPITRLTIEELEVLLQDADAGSFGTDVSTAYSLFPIAFADSDGDSKGDIPGIISKLDYLNDNDPTTSTDLGIDAIWLNPVHPSDTYHKYDVKDYYAIDPSFGTLDDFKTLLSEAHARGIKIIMDIVLNHSADNHPWFQKALNGEKPYDEYYMVFSKLKMSDYPGSKGWYGANSKMYYAGFWNEMPDFNADSDLVRAEFKKILDFWMDLGVDGFRFDAAKHVYDLNEYPTGTQLLQLNKQFWMELKEHVESKDKDVFMVGEVWMQAALAAPYAAGFDSIFNFDLSTGIINVLKNGSSANFLSSYINGQKIFETKTSNYVDSTFLSNHDQDRVLSQLGNNLDKARLAANILFTLPGIPFVYYGEELGMQGMKPDENIREPFVWTTGSNPPMADWVSTKYNKTTVPYDQQVNDPDSMFNHYRELIALRKTSDVLRHGDLKALDIASFRVLGYSRTYNGKTWLILHNVHANQSAPITLEQTGSVVYSMGTYTLDGTSLTLEPLSTLILEVTN